MKRRDWHNRYRQEAGTCKKCGSPDRIQLHHINYNRLEGKSIYEFSLSELKELRLVESLCRRCHLLEHYTDSYEEYSSNPLKHTGYCKSCGKLAIKGWDRAKTYKVTFPICKKCSKAIKNKSKVDLIVNNNGTQFSLF